MSKITAFSQKKVFENAELNVLGNRILNYLEEEFTVVFVQTHFAITGTLAKIIQGARSTPLELVPFITDDLPLYNYIQKSILPKVNAKEAVFFENRIQAKIDGVYFEFWYASNIGTINVVSNLAVQDVADIPSNIK